MQASFPAQSEAGLPTQLHCAPAAAVHVVAGTGGAAFTRNARSPPPAWSERVFYEYGYARVTVFNGERRVGGWVRG